MQNSKSATLSKWDHFSERICPYDIWVSTEEVGPFTENQGSTNNLVETELQKKSGTNFEASISSTLQYIKTVAHWDEVLAGAQFT